MANTVISLRKSATPAATPSTLAYGELALNYADGKLYYKDASNVIKSFTSELPAQADSFGTVNAAGTLIIADTNGDVLNIEAGENITISGNVLTDTIRISATGNVTSADLTQVWNTANAAFVKANNALANTTGTFNGTLTVANSLFVNANTFLDVTATGKLKHLPEPITKALIPYRTSDYQYDFFNAPALNSDASVMAVGARYYDINTASSDNQGAVLIYDWNGTGWIQRGSHITANTPVQYGNFGGSVSIDSEGSILAVGSQGNLSAYIFDWNGTTWVQRSILTGAAGSSYGQSVSLDGPGSTLIVSAVDEIGTGGAKKVYTYDWNGSSWVQRGTEITGATYNFGLSVAISRNGQVLAVSDAQNIYIYDRNSSAWTLRNTIAVVDSYAGDPNYTKGLALNEFGDVLAYSVDDDYYNDPTYGLSVASTVAIQDWNGTSWVLRGHVRKPDYQIVYSQDDRFGVRLSLNDTGSILVAGTTYSSRANTWWGSSGVETGSIHTFSTDGSLPGARAFSMGAGWIEDSGDVFANTSILTAIVGNKKAITIDANSSVNIDSGTFYVDGANNRVGVGTTTPAYKLEINGSFAATTKSFVINHPTKKGMKLRYGSLEGPENGVYIRGRITAEKTITLPDYWHKLVDKDSITVSLTPIGKSQQPSVGKITNKKITLIGDDIDCFYLVFAERKDVEKLQVEI